MHTILGLGNPLLDHNAVVTEDFLGKYDLKLGNAILASPSHLPLFEEMTKLFPVSRTPGGACQNAIRGAQYLLKTPKACSFVGCIGRDSFGESQLKLCTEQGVDARYMVHPTASTGKCASLVINNERSLVAHIGAAGMFDVAHMRTLQPLVDETRIFYVEGFFLMVSMDSIRILAQNALDSTRQGRPKLFCLNLSAVYVMSANWRELEELMPYVDILFANDDEARAYAKAAGWDEADLTKIAQRVADLPKHLGTRRVVFTQGLKPTLVAETRGARVEAFEVVPVPKAELKDTNGAGDSFVGGFLAELSRNAPLTTCVLTGHRLAAQKCRHEGCVWE